MSITAGQIRAASALLKWKQRHLAEASGLPPDTVHRAETGLSAPQRTTLDALRATFEQHGIEFLDNEGVRRRPEGVDILSGHSGLCRLHDLMDEDLNMHGGQVLISGVDEKVWAQHLGAYDVVATSRRAEIVERRKDIQMKCLVREGDPLSDAVTYCEYRATPEEFWNPVPFCVWGSNLAIIVFQADPAPRIWLHRSAIIAASFRGLFMSQWKQARPTTQSRPV